MKKFLNIIYTLLLFGVYTLSAQAPEQFSYQAVVRDAANQLVTNQNVGVQMSIRQGSAGGSVVYQEMHTAMTNANGLFSLEVGGGNSTMMGDFSAIDWGAGPYFIQTEVDPTGGTDYSIDGTSQLLSVPYALFAQNAETVAMETDPTWEGDADLSGAIGREGSVGIGTNSADASAKLEIVSSTQGFLPPRLTTIERDAIMSPAIGLTIFNLTTNCMQWWNGERWWDGCLDAMQMNYSEGTVFCSQNVTQVVPVLNFNTGRTWMDRNLGASRAAMSNIDPLGYGDLYQWGRFSDGHQCRDSDTTSVLSTMDNPGHGMFIVTSEVAPFDWRSPQNDNLWDGINGINNPCPSGYRVPTMAEWDEERMDWSTDDADGAFASPLKLPLGGSRSGSNGALLFPNTDGRYWTSTVNTTSSYWLMINAGSAQFVLVQRRSGASLRCIQD